MLFLHISVVNGYGTPFPVCYWQVCWCHSLDRAATTSKLYSLTVSSLVATVPVCLLCAHTIGCGYPPLSVRAVAKKLSESLQIPALGLFDYNVSLIYSLNFFSSLWSSVFTVTISVKASPQMFENASILFSLMECVYSWHTSLDQQGWEQRVMLTVIAHT